VKATSLLLATTALPQPAHAWHRGDRPGLEAISCLLSAKWSLDMTNGDTLDMSTVPPNVSRKGTKMDGPASPICGWNWKIRLRMFWFLSLNLQVYFFSSPLLVRDIQPLLSTLAIDKQGAGVRDHTVGPISKGRTGGESVSSACPPCPWACIHWPSNPLPWSFYYHHDARLKLPFGSVRIDLVATVKFGTLIRVLCAGPEMTDIQKAGGTGSS